MKSAQGATKDAIDSLGDTMKDVREQASSLVDKIRPQLDSVAGYAKDEPVKAMLMSAAAGAALMAMISLCNRSDLSGKVRSRASGLRDAASEAASDAADRASQAADRASRAAESVLDSTRQTAKSALDGVSDTVQNWREHAAPLVDRVRPQLDSMANYAKEDPAKVLRVAATAAAALLGLIKSLGRNEK